MLRNAQFCWVLSPLFLQLTKNQQRTNQCGIKAQACTIACNSNWAKWQYFLKLTQLHTLVRGNRVEILYRVNEGKCKIYFFDE